jgi:hypothetical protein
MGFMVGLLILNVLVLGANFCFLLIGGTPWQKGEEFAPIHFGKRTYTVERFAVGVSTSVFGASWLIIWFYFLIVGWDSFMAQFSSLVFHVGLQLIASIGLIAAGIAIFKQSKRNKGIFLMSMGTLVISILYAIFMYGPRGHGQPEFMYVVGALTLVVGGFLTTGIYFLDRFVRDSQNNLR